MIIKSDGLRMDLDVVEGILNAVDDGGFKVASDLALCHALREAVALADGYRTISHRGYYYYNELATFDKRLAALVPEGKVSA